VDRKKQLPSLDRGAGRVGCRVVGVGGGGVMGGIKRVSRDENESNKIQTNVKEESNLRAAGAC